MTIQPEYYNIRTDNIIGMTSKDHDKDSNQLSKWWDSLPNNTVSDSRKLIAYSDLWTIMEMVGEAVLPPKVEHVSNSDPTISLRPGLKPSEVIEILEALLKIMNDRGWDDYPDTRSIRRNRDIAIATRHLMTCIAAVVQEDRTYGIRKQGPHIRGIMAFMRAATARQED